MKYVAGVMDGVGRLTERTLFIRTKGKTKMVKRLLESD